jgi:hypothetical protein
MPPRISFESHDHGPCCHCEKRDRTVVNIVLLPLKALPGTNGWGCVVCDLPMEGAYAIICDACVDVPKVVENLKFAVLGDIGKGQRIPISSLIFGAHQHDHSKHPELVHA